MKVTALTAAAVAEDFSFVQIELSSDAGETLRFDVEPSMLMSILNKLAELHRYVQNQTLSIGDHFEIRAVEAVDAFAQAPVGSGKVVIGLKTSNGLIQNFALEPETSARLRPGMRSAEQAARRNSAETRQ